MRIAWFTPYSQHSAIGKCSRTIVAALAKRHDVEIWHSDCEQTFDSPVPLRRFRSADEWETLRLDQYDLVVYNFGNHFAFHREIFFLSRRWPGVCVLHDFVMHHFFAAYYLESLQDRSAYVSSMKRLYGSLGEKIARETGTPGIWETDRVGEFPMVEDIVQGARGVIVHSEFLKTYLAGIFGGPIQRLPLPYPVDHTPVTTTREALAMARDRPLLLTVGHVNPNKCISEVLDALGRVSADGKQYAYAVVGSCPPEYKKELQKIAARNRISPHVHWLGEVNDETLRAFLTHADICLNLRFPAIEGASASVIEQMKFGKAVIVNDTGFFAELPNNCVVKVEPKNVKGLARELIGLLSDPGSWRDLGQQARQFAEQEFDVERYAEGIVQFATEVNRAGPLLRVADRLASELKQMGVAGSSGLIRSTAQVLFALFCGSPEEP